MVAVRLYITLSVLEKQHQHLAGQYKKIIYVLENDPIVVMKYQAICYFIAGNRVIQQKLLRKECTGEREKLTRGIREMRKIKPYIENDMLIENRPWTPLWQTQLSLDPHLPPLEK